MFLRKNETKKQTHDYFSSKLTNILKWNSRVVILLKPRTIKTTISDTSGNTSFICSTNEPTLFPQMKFISKTLFSRFYRAFHEFPTIL